MTAGQVWAKREYIMKINGVTVFQETLTMNPSLYASTGRKTYTHPSHYACVIRRLRTELKSLRHSSLATMGTMGGHTQKRWQTKWGSKKGNSHRHPKWDWERQRQRRFYTVYSRLPSLLHLRLRIRPLPRHLLNSNPLLCVMCRSVDVDLHLKQWIKQLIGNSFCQSECNYCVMEQCKTQREIPFTHWKQNNAISRSKAIHFTTELTQKEPLARCWIT